MNKSFLVVLAAALALTGCAGGLGVPTDSTTNRGDAGANKPVQGSTIVNSCQDKANGGTQGDTIINNTNNCNKDNPVTTTSTGGQ